MESWAERLRGLSAAEVQQRVCEGRTNDMPDAPVRTLGAIVRSNVLNPVNAIMSSMFVVIVVAGFPGDALFVGVVASNSVIGIVQELKARRELRQLAVLSAPQARVVRDGTSRQVGTSSVVADDTVELRPGDQVVVDGEVLVANGLEVDESLLTGESDPVTKTDGDRVMSGSFVSAGAGFCRATAIGADSYAAKLSQQARAFKLARSELRGAVNVILRWLTVIIPPAVVVLLMRLLAVENRWQEALRGSVAAAVAMVPDGLVLLTSLSLLTGVIALARHRALAKELGSVELLARVDTLCVDKTGTITTGEISLERVEPLGEATEASAVAALAALGAADPAPNTTMIAVIDGVGAPLHDWRLRRSVPFSSARKWAAASFEGRGTFHLGAPDILLGLKADRHADTPCATAGTETAEHQRRHARARAAAASAQGARVLAVTRSDETDPTDNSLPADREPVCLVHLADTIRSDAPEIFAYFRDQGVDLKVISGDHPATVASVASRAGITGESRRADRGPAAFDARDLPEDPDALADTLEANTAFGRVDPHQKRALVHALQSRGRTVAMTGDGVNDVLALKDADMGIAMGTGSSATRAVAHLVLLDNRFATLPRVLAESRRVINNIERVANLFITKATYAVLLTALIGLAGSPFPFLPRHLTLIGVFSVGVPGFFLALAPNHELVRPGFLNRVLRFSLPAGTAAATATFVLYEIVRRLDDVSLNEARTAATMTLLGIGLVVLVLISRPLRPWKVALAAAMATSCGVTMLWSLPRAMFLLDAPPPGAWLWVAVAVAAGAIGALLATDPQQRLSTPTSSE